MGPQSGQRGALVQAAVRGAGLGRLGGAGAGLSRLGGAGVASSAAPTAVTMTRASVTMMVSMLWLLTLETVTGDHVWPLRSRFQQFHQPGVPGLAAPRAADIQDTLSPTARKDGIILPKNMFAVSFYTQTH